MAGRNHVGSGDVEGIARALAGGEISRRSALKRLAGGTLAAGVASIPGAEALAARDSKRCPQSRRCGDKCCPAHSKCKRGKCKCNDGYTKCGKKCADLQTSVKHCGECGNACADGETCSGGECVSPAMVPSNVSPGPGLTCGAETTTDLVVTGPATLNTDTGCTTTQSQGAGSPELCVVVRRNVSIASTGVLTVSGSRALAILATGDIAVNGTIDASATNTAPGPGSAPAAANGAQGTSSARNGGGGGGHGTAGASGAPSGTGGGSGGQAVGTPQAVPLLGGGHGGANADAPPNTGGGGGGGLQLSACGTMSVGATGIVDAGGGGGQGGGGSNGPSDVGAGGAGGGAGGSVLLEAPAVVLAGGGMLVSNGGGGGGGGEATAAPTGLAGGAGSNGQRSAVPAMGGPAAAAGAGAGGNGGAGSTPPTPGATATGSQGAGGGGGAVGRIRINTGGPPPDTSGLVVSPPATTGSITTA